MTESSKSFTEEKACQRSAQRKTVAHQPRWPTALYGPAVQGRMAVRLRQPTLHHPGLINSRVRAAGTPAKRTAPRLRCLMSPKPRAVGTACVSPVDEWAHSLRDKLSAPFWRLFFRLAQVLELSVQQRAEQLPMLQYETGARLMRSTWRCASSLKHPTRPDIPMPMRHGSQTHCGMLACSQNPCVRCCHPR